MRFPRFVLYAVALMLSCAAATGHAQSQATWLTTLRQDAERLVKSATADDFAAFSLGFARRNA